MQIVDLNSFNLLIAEGPVGASAAFPNARLNPTVTFAPSPFYFLRDYYIHAILGSVAFSTNSSGQVHGVFLMKNQDIAEINMGVGSNVLFSMLTSTVNDGLGQQRLTEVNEQIYFDNPILVRANQPLSIYVSRAAATNNSADGYITLLVEIP